MFLYLCSKIPRGWETDEQSSLCGAFTVDPVSGDHSLVNMASLSPSGLCPTFDLRETISSTLLKFVNLIFFKDVDCKSDAGGILIHEENPQSLKWNEMQWKLSAINHWGTYLSSLENHVSLSFSRSNLLSQYAHFLSTEERSSELPSIPTSGLLSY